METNLTHNETLTEDGHGNTTSIDQANHTLDRMEKIPTLFLSYIKHCLEGTCVNLTDRQIDEACKPYIDDMCADMFHDERHRLMDIAGWRAPYVRNPNALPTTSEMFTGMLRDMNRTFPTNPSTYAAKGESL